MSRQRHWVFTSFCIEIAGLWNNAHKEPAVGEWEKTFAEEVCYLCFQLELSPETNRLHLQGYVKFGKATRMATAKRILGDPGIHLEPMRGTIEQAIAYATKNETRVEGPFSYGAIPKSEQGKRTDLHELRDGLAREGLTADIWDKFFPTLLRYENYQALLICLIDITKARKHTLKRLHYLVSYKSRLPLLSLKDLQVLAKALKLGWPTLLHTG